MQNAKCRVQNEGPAWERASRNVLLSDRQASFAVSPPLTVLLSVHNGRRYLREAVQSILDQSFGDFEFLIINDGSTDDSLEILNEFAQSDSRIRIVSRANRGLTVTLNEGITLARGEFIARMDADDIALPDRLEKQLTYLQDNPECVLVGSRVLLVDPDGLPIREICNQQSHEDIDYSLMTHGWPLVHPAVTLRASAVRAIGGYSEKYRTNQDHDLFLRLAEHGRLANLPDTLLKYRQHEKSISMGNVKKRIDPLEKILEEAHRRRGTISIVKKASPRALSKITHHQNWAWAALAAGHLATARKHALAAIAKMPLSLQSWRMLYCALRGR
jgi:glycosyltransferase involved in cell wall biosynthesis